MYTYNTFLVDEINTENFYCSLFIIHASIWMLFGQSVFTESRMYHLLHMRNAIKAFIHCVNNILVKKRKVCTGKRIMFHNYATGAEVCPC